MEILKTISGDEIARLVRRRSGEEKLGELAGFAGKSWQEELAKQEARFVILGIAEDIGVRANYGRAGAGTAFRPALDSFLNQQSNAFLTGAELFVLGEVMTDDLVEASTGLDLKVKANVDRLRSLVEQLDVRVSEVIRLIISAGKIPVVIGGGHNNAFGNIKGTSEALGKKINVINCDPHLDFRPLEGRHSGNGFSYAFEGGYLERYSVFGMHEQYNNKTSLERFAADPSHLFYSSYESVFVRQERDFLTALSQCAGFVKEGPCGIEIDLDAITNVPSSAKTSSGISPVQARRYVHRCATQLNARYLHIAEGAPVLSHIKADNKTGKLIAYLATDFIKGILQADQKALLS